MRMLTYHDFVQPVRLLLNETLPPFLGEYLAGDTLKDIDYLEFRERVYIYINKLLADGTIRELSEGVYEYTDNNSLINLNKEH